MRRIISALLFSVASTALTATMATAVFAATTATPVAPKAGDAKATEAPLELAEGAPDRYIVVPGDTLWDLATKFLKTPYRWAELWKLNADEIKKPHWIYPGQVLILDKKGNQPHLRLATVKESRREYVEPFKKSITSIPPQDIEPFLSEPRVVEESALENVPRVVALTDGRVIAGTHDFIFTTVPTMTSKNWQIFRPGKPLLDPDTKAVLGYEAFFLGTAKLVREGNPTKFEIKSSKEEVMKGDRLMSAPAQDVVNYVPRAPGTLIKAKVLASYGGVNFIGPQSVLTLNRGQVDGLEPGHVLAVDIAGRSIDDRYKGEKTTYKLPDERNGLVFVFRVFNRVSYALVLSSTAPIVVGDTLRTP